MICIDTGANIAAIPLTNPATVFVSETTEAGYLQDEMYITRADKSGRAAVRRAHNHSTSSDSDGGDIYDIDVANAGSRLSIGPRSTKAGFFDVKIQGANPATVFNIDNFNSTGVITMRLKTRNTAGTATAANDFTQVSDGGLALSFGSRIEWRIKMQVARNPVVTPITAILWRAGVNMEAVDVAGDATQNRFGLEGCSSAGEFIGLICANGGGVRTNIQTGIAMHTPMRGYAMRYTPGTNIIFTDSTGNSSSLTANVPSTGSIASDKQLKYGIKTTDTAEKIMFVAADALFGKIVDTLWVS